jgi:endonuclease YncB( thermonuclease family)
MQRNLGRGWRLGLSVGFAAVAFGVLVEGTAWAQSGDMDVAPTAPLAAPPAPHQSGGLDMDASPTAPVAAGAPAAKKPGGNVQDGIVVYSPTPVPTPAPDQTASTPQPSPTIQPAPAIAAPAVAGPAIPAEPVSLDHPSVIDTAKLKAGDTTVTLFGIEGQTGEAAQSLQSFLSSTNDHLTCQAQTANDFVCLLPDGTDVAQAALVNGAARALPDAPEAYREQESLAQAGRRGIWANLPPPPLVVKHPTVVDTATLATADGQKIALDGIIGLGQPYAGELQSYIAANGDSLNCQPQAEPDHYVCVLNDGTDIAKVALVNGGARVAADAPDAYRVQQAEALDNKRGFWVNPPPDILLAATSARAPVCCAYAAGDDGRDGITYAGGVPVAVIGGVSTFLVFGGLAGWGYYDATHHWHTAPASAQAHMQRYHPGASGLRGYQNGVVLAHGTAPGGYPRGPEAGGMRGPGAGGMRGPEAGGPRGPGGPHEPGGAPGGGRQYGMAGAGGAMGAGGHQGAPSSGFHAGAPGGGFVRPPPSPGGFHPGGGAPRGGGVPLTAPHPTQLVHSGGGGGGGGEKKHR